LPWLPAEANRVSARIFFADEAGLRSNHHAGANGAHAPGADHRSALRDVQPAYELCHVILHDGRVTAAAFIAVFERLLHDVNRPVSLIVDGHCIHTARLVGAFVRRGTSATTMLFFLWRGRARMQNWPNLQRPRSHMLLASGKRRKTVLRRGA
jgi:hypothetical protein